MTWRTRAPPSHQRVGEERSVAAPRDGLGAHDHERFVRARSTSSRDRLCKLLGLHVVGVGPEPLVPEPAIDGFVGRQGPTQTSKGRAVAIADPTRGQRGSERGPVEMGIAPRARQASDVDNGPAPILFEQLQKLVKRSRRVADGHDQGTGVRHAVLPCAGHGYQPIAVRQICMVRVKAGSMRAGLAPYLDLLRLHFAPAWVLLFCSGTLLAAGIYGGFRWASLRLRP